MKKLLILSLAIFCFYGCKSTSSDESAFPNPNATWSADGTWSPGTITKSQYVQLTRSLDPLGLVWDHICNKNEASSIKDIERFSTFVFKEVKEDSNNATIDGFYHTIRLNSMAGTVIDYTHFFNKKDYTSYNASKVMAEDRDYISFNPETQKVTYSHDGNNKYSILGNPENLKKEETFVEFCQKYEDTYTDEVKSNYKILNSETERHSVEANYRRTTLSVDKVTIEGINQKAGESMQVDIISEGKIKGLSAKTTEKDVSGNTTTKTMIRYDLL